ncbi:MAG TPA: hypothetical protein VKV16_06525 [Solirubrobacteraceae bacterium]|nr:hypothetical protein [Solirubrobacteraceae bacterium]
MDTASTAPTAPSAVYTDADGNELELRGSLTARSRAQYAATLAGGAHREDAWQRATELLFERLAVSWTVAGVRTEDQRELLGRYRMASSAERRFVRESLRAHVREHFPELQAP